jgi:ribosomal protein S18 acetylase RimI-like enzyme
VTIRDATDADRGILIALWDEWVGDGPLPPWVEGARDGTIEAIDEALQAGAAVVAEEEEGEVVGFACGLLRGSRSAEITELYVRPAARRRGFGRQLLRAVVDGLEARGAQFVSVEVGVDNGAARTLYDRAGLEPELIRLVGPVERLAERLEARPPGRSYGAIHVQSDDEPAVERAVRQFVPRLPGGSRGSIVSPPRNGWIAVYDDVCDRDPKLLRRLARELSDRMGAVVLALGVEEGAVARFVLLERGSIVDEYLSVQEFYGSLPPGDVVALAANPRVVSRLTGADPAAVRAAAKHASSPSELPPPAELLAEIAAAIGVEGAGHGWADAPEIPGAVRIERS